VAAGQQQLEQRRTKSLREADATASPWLQSRRTRPWLGLQRCNAVDAEGRPPATLANRNSLTRLPRTERDYGPSISYAKERLKHVFDPSSKGHGNFLATAHTIEERPRCVGHDREKPQNADQNPEDSHDVSATPNNGVERPGCFLRFSGHPELTVQECSDAEART